MIMKTSIHVVLFLMLSVTGVNAMTQEGCGGDCAGCHSMTVAEANTLFTGIAEVKSVRQAAVRGLFELVAVQNGREAVVYMDYGKKSLIPGPIFDLATRKPITEPLPQAPKPSSVQIDMVPVDNSIVMGNPHGKKKLFVFTDPDCPFCRKLHPELQKLAAAEPDLAIYVKMYPLKMHPNAYDKARAILGSGSREVLDRAFAGGSLPPAGDKAPAKPVDDTMRYAESIGISSTPTLILPDGHIVAGYREAGELQKLLNGMK
jgi:thiol:disulfide interchange protein DsbC